MKSPLALDKETVDKYKIPKSVEQEPRAKIAFLQEQLQQLKAMHWRARVDMLHSARLMESPIEALAENGTSNMAKHRNEVQQTVGAIEMIQKLIEELRAEYPEPQVKG